MIVCGFGPQCAASSSSSSSSIKVGGRVSGGGLNLHRRYNFDAAAAYTSFSAGDRVSALHEHADGVEGGGAAASFHEVRTFLLRSVHQGGQEGGQESKALSDLQGEVNSPRRSPHILVRLRRLHEICIYDVLIRPPDRRFICGSFG